MNTSNNDIPLISPEDAKKRLEAGSAQVLDVREHLEFVSGHIPGALSTASQPLKHRLEEVSEQQNLIFVCSKGVRAQASAEKAVQLGRKNLSVLEGGLDAWKKHRLPVQAEPSPLWSMERQVRLAAGSFVLAGVGLGFWVHPGFYGLAAFVGAGLAFSALTNSCAMGMIIMKLPWNKK